MLLSIIRQKYKYFRAIILIIILDISDITFKYYESIIIKI